MYVQTAVLALLFTACLATAIPGQAMGRPQGSVPAVAAPLPAEGINMENPTFA